MSSQTIGIERLQRARQAYRHCLLCEHRCGVDRAGGERGFCGATSEARVYRCRVECGEEIELIPSQLLYLSGCNLRCLFCIGEVDAFDPQRGRLLTSQLLAEASGCRTRAGSTEFSVGRRRTDHSPSRDPGGYGWLRPLPPVVWKSNFYGTIEGLALLEGLVDVYVADLKFGNDTCARQIAGLDGYIQIVTRNLLLAAEGDSFDVRHLLLPGHLECCYLPVVDWMYRHLPGVPFRIMTGYLPRWQASRCRDLAAPLERDVWAHAVAVAREKGLNVIA